MDRACRHPHLGRLHTERYAFCCLAACAIARFASQENQALVESKASRRTCSFPLPSMLLSLSFHNHIDDKQPSKPGDGRQRHELWRPGWQRPMATTPGSQAKCEFCFLLFCANAAWNKVQRGTAGGAPLIASSHHHLIVCPHSSFWCPFLTSPSLSLPETPQWHFHHPLDRRTLSTPVHPPKRHRKFLPASVRQHVLLGLP